MLSTEKESIPYAIQLQGVNKWFGQMQVLKNINLSIKAGENVVVCGPSGLGQIHDSAHHQFVGILSTRSNFDRRNCSCG